MGDRGHSIMFTGTAKEKFFYHNTLLCLVKAMQGQNVLVDLRNDTCVCGQIMTVDGFMNISFSNAVYVDPQGNEYKFENLFVQARNVRYLHIPESVPILGTIKRELIKKKEEPKDKPAVKSRKAQKALQRHMKTVELLETTAT